MSTTSCNVEIKISTEPNAAQPTSADQAAVNTPKPGEITESATVKVLKSFDDMNLREDLLRGIYAHGFENPSPIQEKAIVPMAAGGDIIAQAQSGTGKTGAYTTGMLQQLDLRKRGCQALILTPTRELADQVTAVVNAIGTYMEGLKVHACMGGTSISNEIQTLKRGVHVIVGTPGRVLDMIERGHLRTHAIKTFILDEADEMLSAGFRDKIYEIFIRMDNNVQCAIFSATFPPRRTEADEIAAKFLRNPTRVVVPKEELSLAGIKQFYVDVQDPRWKFETLCDLYETLSVAQSVVFVNSRRNGEWLYNAMSHREFTCGLIHGSMPAAERLAVMTDYRLGRLRVLIATDLLARGIDVQGVTFVLNYDVPSDPANYLHRIGRSGRYGRKGIAISLVAGPGDMRIVRDLSGYYECSIEALPANVAEML